MLPVEAIIGLTYTDQLVFYSHHHSFIICPKKLNASNHRHESKRAVCKVLVRHELEMQQSYIKSVENKQLINGHYRVLGLLIDEWAGLILLMRYYLGFRSTDY